jgi:hypothetical protein
MQKEKERKKVLCLFQQPFLFYFIQLRIIEKSIHYSILGRNKNQLRLSKVKRRGKKRIFWDFKSQKIPQIPKNPKKSQNRRAFFSSE